MKRDAAAIAATGVVLAGCAEILHRTASHLPEKASPVVPGPESRLASRLGFGPAPGQIDEIKKLGIDSYIEQQLKGDQPEPMMLTAQIQRLEVMQCDPIDLLDIPDPEAIRQLNQVAMLRAIYSKNQLKERMVDFWTNHFNISAKKAFGAFYLVGDQKSVIRQHALGSFPKMLTASAHSPAMLEYLDNQVNQKGKANENYAREIMELHTLGVGSGYTQGDVHEVARCFTGWSVEKRAFKKRGQFVFLRELHDEEPKSVLGHKLAAGLGKGDGDWVVKTLATHPWTAAHLARKLAVYFLGAQNERLQAEMASAFLTSNGDIAAMLRPMLFSPAFLDGQGAAQRPLDYVISTLRLTGAVTNCNKHLQNHLANMGQPLYQWPMPDGYPNGADHWQGSLLARWNYAYLLANGGISGTRIPVSDLEKCYDAQDTELIRRATGIAESNLALALAAPEMNWR